jgi:ATP-dependent Clp protease adaptor protein ClpS
MDSNLTSRPQKTGSSDAKSNKLAYLILHNDEVNSFDFVMEALVEVCDHSLVQAEQCTMIAHNKGKCDVRRGEMEEMKELRYHLVSRGLKATIE